MFIKICGITTEDDALLAVALGADAVGFVFAPSTRRIAPQRVFDITPAASRDHDGRRLPRRGTGAPPSWCGRPGEAAQLHGHETPGDTRAVKNRSAS